MRSTSEENNMSVSLFVLLALVCFTNISADWHGRKVGSSPPPKQYAREFTRVEGGKSILVARCGCLHSSASSNVFEMVWLGSGVSINVLGSLGFPGVLASVTCVFPVLLSVFPPSQTCGEQSASACRISRYIPPCKRGVVHGNRLACSRTLSAWHGSCRVELVTSAIEPWQLVVVC